MISNNGQSQQLGQRVLASKTSSGSVVKPRVEKIRRRHRSLENDRQQSTNTIPVSVRKPDGNQTNNNKSLAPTENLLGVRYYLTVLHIFYSLFCLFSFHQFSVRDINSLD